MGKKDRKLKKTQNFPYSVELSEQDVTNLPNLERNNTILNNSAICDDNIVENVNKKKKKRKHESVGVANTSLQTAIEEIIPAVDDPDTITLETKMKKKKKHTKQDETLAVDNTEIVNVNNDIKDDCEITIKKKKKNKSKSLIEEDSIHDNVQVNKELLENETKISKKKKKKDGISNGDSVTEDKSIEQVDFENKLNVTKSQKKKRTGTAVLNAEESQVTEEDIDRFCDEIDEEDNKQYENWVKLLEASLPPARKNT